MQIAVFPIFQNLREFWVIQFSAWNLFNSISDVAQNNKTIKLSGLLFEHCSLRGCKLPCHMSEIFPFTIHCSQVFCIMPSTAKVLHYSAKNVVFTDVNICHKHPETILSSFYTYLFVIFKNKLAYLFEKKKKNCRAARSFF